MSPFDIWISFILSLITNMIVLSGSISFLFWLDEQTNLRITRIRPLIETTLSTLFLIFLWAESWLHTTIEPNGFGLHWTFLNMLIITMFLLNIHLGIWWQGIIEAVLMFGYVALYAKDLNLIVLSYYVGFAAMLFVSYQWREELFRHVWLIYLSLALMSFTTISLVASMAPSNTDGYFWLRQITALVILSITGVEYTRASMKTLRRNQQTATLAKTDGLTRLNNFSQFDLDLGKAFDHYRETQDAYAVFELDIDLFKRVNDSFGHPMGNTVLRAVAQELSFFAVNSPYPLTVYRIGGEEFGLIVRKDCTDPSIATDIATQVRERISRLRFDINGSPVRVTVSVGQANSRPDQYNSHDIYKAADRSLYLSKRRGRDRVTIEGRTLSI